MTEKFSKADSSEDREIGTEAEDEISIQEMSLILPKLHSCTGKADKPDSKLGIMTKWRKQAKRQKTASEVNNDQRLSFDTSIQMVQSIQSQLPPLQIPRAGDIYSAAGGMRKFGINKTGITRAVMNFTDPPRGHPYTVCFHFPGTFLTHRYVLDVIRSKMTYVTDAVVTALQFVDRNTFHGSRGLDNRWLITVNSHRAREELIKLGLNLYNRKVPIQRYDDILSEEYQEFLAYESYQGKIFIKLGKQTAKPKNQDIIGK